MKIKIILPVAFLMAFTNVVQAQCPQAVNFHAIFRDAIGNPLANTPIAVRFTVSDSIHSNTPVYQEIISSACNIFGLFTPQIGRGVAYIGTFSTINWAVGGKSLQIETKINGNSSFVNMGTKTIASHPYALYADVAGKGGYPKHYIGEYYGGGIVFYVTGNGQHGLIADSADLQTGTDSEPWDTTHTVLLNAGLTGTGGGSSNTERIIIGEGAGNYAAQLCANYSGGGYGDWFLPSGNELSLLYNQQQVVGGFTAASLYWSSTETDATTAVALNFTTGANANALKSAMNNVRAVRAF